MACNPLLIVLEARPIGIEGSSMSNVRTRSVGWRFPATQVKVTIANQPISHDANNELLVEPFDLEMPQIPRSIAGSRESQHSHLMIVHLWRPGLQPYITTVGATTYLVLPY